MLTQDEFAEKLEGLGTKLDKVKTEFTAAIAELTEAVRQAGNATPRMEAALTKATDAAQGLDDLNVDPETPADPNA